MTSQSGQQDIAKHCLNGRGNVNIFSCGIEREDEVTGVFYNQAVFLFAFPQRFFGLLSLGNVVIDNLVPQLAIPKHIVSGKL